MLIYFLQDFYDEIADQIFKLREQREKCTVNYQLYFRPLPQVSLLRNRNLFYVCCSRPKKRLYFFVSVPIDRVFRKFLTEMVGEDNILTYSEFLNSQNHSKTE